MKKNKNTLLHNILKYFILFSVILLLFLYLFQILFLNTYYEISRTKYLNEVINTLSKNYADVGYASLYDEIYINNNICIEIVSNNKIIYSSSVVDKKCINRKNSGLLSFQTDFILSGKKNGKAEIINPNYNNKTLVRARKIDASTYLFVNTSLVPLDDSIKILKSQFIFVALIVLVMAFIVSYFISKRLSIPISTLNREVKKIGKKDYNIKFNNNTNVLEFDELSDSLNNMIGELSKTDSLRRELMANVSHDLKTPLTLIRAYAEVAKDLDSDKKEKREKDLEIIIEETERLTVLVNDILELSKLESNIVNIELSEFNIKELIESLINKFDILKKDGYEFIINSNDIIVTSDRRKLEQVIYNLINNAINYTGPDKKVIINVLKKEDKIRVEIIDTGNGIEEKDINLIWEKYYKVDKKHTRNKYGTGLGLSIVKSTLISLGYEYGVDSNINKGTTFYFEIKDNH